MRILLFLGSGVSLASDLPDVSKLTEALLGESDGAPMMARDVSQSAIPIAAPLDNIRRLLRLLRDTDDHYLKSIGLAESGGGYQSSGAIFRSSTSYEDLAYMANCIAECGDGLLDDAPAGAFADLIEKKAGDLLEGETREARVVYLTHLSQEASRFIRAYVAASLRNKRVEGLDLIVELARSSSVEQLDIVTLNHDTLVEQLLARHLVEYVDGFGVADGDVRWHDDSTYDRDHTRIRIIKPHGSIDWYAYLRQGLRWEAIATGSDPLASRDSSGQELTPYLKSPSLLAGANKALHYNNRVFSDMLYRFHQALRRNWVVVMSGYGWGDTGISMKFDYWLDHDRGNKLVLLHENPGKLRDRSLLFASGYDSWVKNGQLIPVGTWLSKCSLAELQSAIGN